MFGTKMTLAAMVMGVGLLAAGCESMGGSGGAGGASASRDNAQAVACEKCKVTWVKSPVTSDKGRVIAYKTRQSHECPDCRNAVANFFSTGKLEHACATSGDNALQKCEAHVRR
jgi:hypothetical protein